MDRGAGYCTEQPRIVEIGAEADLDICAEVIREAFATVARQFGLTISNCPAHPAFLETDTLRKMRGSGACFLGLTMADRLTGLVAVKIRDKQCHIEKLSVLPGYRHRGFGKRLMEAALAYAKEKNCQGASIGIIDENRVLKDWYMGMGFLVAEKKTYEHLPFTVCRMDTIL